MSMAPCGTLFMFGALFFSLGNARTFVNVDCKAEQVGQYGKHTMLDCVVHFRVKDVKIMIVTWKKDEVDIPILAYNGMDGTAAHISKEPGYQFADEPWNNSNRNVSLLITNTELAHTGKYTCDVITDSGIATNSVNLKVTAKYNKPTIQKSGENGFECHSDGGYPQGELRWIVDNVSWKQFIETDVRKSQSGTYNLSSKLTLMKDSQFLKFTCVVFNASGEKENEDTMEIPQKSDGSNKQQSRAEVVAPLVVIGSLIVGLLLLLFLRRRSRREPQVCRCEIDAEQGADQVMIDKCEEKVCMKE